MWSCDHDLFLVCTGETTDGDYARKNRVVVVGKG
jgi:hypothetical protein